MRYLQIFFLLTLPALAQLTFDPANPPSAATPPTELYNEYTGLNSHQKGPKTVLVFLVQPSDGAVWTNPKSFATLDSELNSASQNYYDASYHQTWFGSKRRSGMDIPRLVVTPVLVLPKTAAQYLASFGTLQSDCQAALRALGGVWAAGQVNDYNNFDRWAVMSNTKLISSTGLAYVGGKFAWTGGGLSGGVAVHEWGHNWGVVHANDWSVPSGDAPRAATGSSGEYQDGWDIMGGNSTAVMFNPQFRENLGFLERSRGEALDISASGTYRLYDYVHPYRRQDSGTVRALVIPMSSFTDSKRVILGFGHTSGTDGGISRGDWNRNAVTVHSKLSDGANRIDTTPESRDSGDADDSSIKIGRTYSEGAAVNGTQIYGGFHVTPVLRGNTMVNGVAHEWVDVVVNYQNAITANQTPDVPVLSSSNSSVMVGGRSVIQTDVNVAVPFSASCVDPDGDTLAWDWDYGRTGNNAFNILNSNSQSPVYPQPGLYRVRATASDMKGGLATGSAWVNVGAQPLHADTVVNTVPGLSYRYFEGNFTSIPDFSKLFPIKEGTSDGLSLAPRNRNDEFAFVYDGYLNVPATDVYTFHLRAEDGARLYINNVLVVDNGSNKDVSMELLGSQQLEAGLHPIRVEFFHKSGSEFLQLSWSTLDLEKTMVPAANLVQVDPAVNAAPVVAVLTPMNGEEFVVNASILLTASAADADGIDRVQYFFEGAFLGESTDAAGGFPVLWNEVSVGVKTIIALAYDSTGRPGKSAARVFQVNAPEPRNTLALNFGATDLASSVQAGESVGAIYSTANWNNLNGDTGSNVSVFDQTRNASGARVSWASDGAGSGTFSSLADGSTAAGRLMRGGIRRRYDIEPQPNPDPYAVIENISFVEYDVYVYFDQARNNGEDTTVQRFVLSPEQGDARVVFGKNSQNTTDDLGDYPVYDTWIGFREAKGSSVTDTADKLLGNYVVFRNVSGSSFKIASTRNNGLTSPNTTGRHGRYFNAVQIVETPATIPQVLRVGGSGLLQVSEGGSGGSYALRLSIAPDADVTVNISHGAQVLADKTQLVFTPANWNQPQGITVSAVDDTAFEGTHADTLTHTVVSTGLYAAVTSAPSLPVTILDNDAPTVSVALSRPAAEASTPQAGAFWITRGGLGSYAAPLTLPFQMSGTAALSGDYTLSGASVSYNSGTGLGTLVIPANQAQVFLTLTPINDSTVEGPETATLTLLDSPDALPGTVSASLPISDDDAVDYFTQLFASAQDFDLNGKSILFTPNGNNYTASTATVSAFPSGTSSFSTFNEAAMTAGSADDGHWTYTLPAAFPFFGTSRTTAYVSTNGHISFAGTSWSDSGDSLASHFTSGRPRISAIARDLDPGAGGSVQYRRITTSGEQRTVIYYNAVRNFGQTTTLSCQIELFDDGRIRMTWLSSTLSGAMVAGLSSGDTTTMPSSPFTTTSSPRPLYGSDLSAYVAPANLPPSFASAAPVVATAGQLWTYAVVCTDANNDSLTITATEKPAWLNLAALENGRATLSGTPPASGSYPVTLNVGDGTANASQSFVLTALLAEGNRPPQFNSSPILAASAGETYLYTISVSDPDGQTLSVSAPVKPGWMTLLDAGNGSATLSGTIPAEAVDASVLLDVSDGIISTLQRFTLAINQPPVTAITLPASPVLRVTTGTTVLLQGTVSDDGVPAAPTQLWSVVSGPAAVGFSNPSALITEARFDVPGSYRIRLEATDGAALSRSEITVLVSTDADALRQNGLQGHWTFEEGSGTTSADLSGLNRTATVTGLTWSAGYAGGGVSSDANTSKFADAALPEPEKVTLAGWVTAATVPATADRVLWAFRDSGNNNRFRVYLANGTRKIRVLSDRNPDGVWECDTLIRANTWFHLAVAFDRASAANVPTLYINGLPQPLTTITAPAGSLSIGNTSFRMAGSWSGALDEVRVYDRIVPAAEIPLLMVAGGFWSAPEVSAGPDVEGLVEQPVPLNGSVSDTDLVSQAWSVRSGPGTVQFADASASVTEAVFSSPGEYVLQLLAVDATGLQALDTVTVILSNGSTGSDANSNNIPDTWEIDNFERLLGEDETLTRRGREVPAYDVYVWGMDPQDENAVLEVLSPQSNAGNFAFSFPSVTGRRYEVSRSDSLADANAWTVLDGFDAVDGTGAAIPVTDPAPGPLRVYRIRVWIP